MKAKLNSKIMKWNKDIADMFWNNAPKKSNKFLLLFSSHICPADRSSWILQPKSMWLRDPKEMRRYYVTFKLWTSEKEMETNGTAASISVSKQQQPVPEFGDADDFGRSCKKFILSIV
ncbi:hypothetical protein EJB05_09386 [Eragrostis curvula]|uniref:Uncharacterized protein n=1 Tax=Eragrostis curvula TaxID=38414 RepID=A0A5J9W3M0_9POAL|nr:hypothetical protein EJB05_09386 [Eragrostis curvula]